jgi:hypothetical protein
MTCKPLVYILSSGESAKHTRTKVELSQHVSSIHSAWEVCLLLKQRATLDKAVDLDPSVLLIRIVDLNTQAT